MKKNAFILLAVVLCVSVLGSVLLVGAADPATQADPIVTKSYIDDVLVPAIYDYIDEKIADGAASESSSFQVVTVGAGKTITGEAGTEFILRMGKGTVVGSARGGLSDVTDGIDLLTGAEIPSNHLLIVPLSDGRGLKINKSNDALVMVKGNYTIK